METRGHANRTFARKKLSWIDPFCTQCRVFCAEPLGACPNGGKITLISNNDLHAIYEGSLRVVRMLASIYFVPDPATIVDPCDLTPLFNPVLMRLGLKRSQVTDQDNNVPRAVNPMDCGADSSAGQVTGQGDLTEARFMKVYDHAFNPTGQAFIDNGVAKGCCAVVSGGASAIENGITWSVTEGAIDTSISTECTPCPTSPEDPQCVTTLGTHIAGPWRWQADVKFGKGKGMQLKEDHSFDLWFGWETLQLCTTDPYSRPAQVRMNFYGSIRLLIEK